jgi:Methyltransferase domain
VEPGGNQQFYQVLENLNGIVHHLKATSNVAASSLKRLLDLDGNLPEFIMVDGDHSYEGVRNDIIEYFPLLAPGGLMVFHDFLPPLNEANAEAILCHHGGKEPGIRQACLELIEGSYGCRSLSIPLLYPSDPSQTQAHLPVIPGVFSTIRVYRKPAAGLQRQTGFKHQSLVPLNI